MYIGALVGCFGDAYTGEGCLNRTDALAFHSWEVELFAKEDIDFFMAGLMPNAEETLGLAQAISMWKYRTLLALQSAETDVFRMVPN